MWAVPTNGTITTGWTHLECGLHVQMSINQQRLFLGVSSELAEQNWWQFNLGSIGKHLVTKLFQWTCRPLLFQQLKNATVGQHQNTKKTQTCRPLLFQQLKNTTIDQHHNTEWRHGKRKQLIIFLERMRKGHCQSDKHWNCLKGSIGETSERWGGVHNIYKQTLIYKYINFYDCVCELFFVMKRWWKWGKERVGGIWRTDDCVLI